MSYDLVRPRRMLGQRSPATAYTPPGAQVSLGQTLPWAIEDALEAIGLVRYAVLTPWATSETGVGWEDVPQPPSDVLAAYPVQFEQLRQIREASLGNWMPFVVIVGDKQPNVAALEAELEGTPYRFHELMAVYSQDDPSDVPTPLYMTWLEARPIDDPAAGERSLQQAAMTRGLLAIIEREPYEGHSKREPPPMTWGEAIGEAQPGPIAPPAPEPGLPIPMPPPVTYPGDELDIPAPDNQSPPPEEQLDPRVNAPRPSTSDYTALYVAGGLVLGFGVVWLMTRPQAGQGARR